MLSNNGVGVQIGRWVGSPTTVALSVSSNRSLLKAFTAYRIWSSVDCFIKFGTVAVTAATTDNPLKAGLDVVLHTDAANIYVAGIVSSGTGTLFATEVSLDI